MPKNDIGGFFVSLGLNIDKNSWDTGNRLIDGMGNSLNKLMGTARNAAVVLAGTAIATGTIESTAYKTASAIGISTEALDLWKASAKIAGVDANGLVSAMARMSEVMSGMTIDGRGLEAFTTQLGELGLITSDLDIEKLLKLSPDELMKEILIKAQGAVEAGQDKTKVSLIVKDILGEAGQQFFIELDRMGVTLDEFLVGAQKTIFTDSKTNQDAQDFMEQFRILKTTSENLSRLFGSSVAKQLTGHLEDLNNWLGNHGTDLKNGVQKVAEGIGKIVNGVVDVATNEKVQNTAKGAASAIKTSVSSSAKGMYHVLHGAINGDWDEVLEGLSEQWSATGGMIIGGAKKAVSGKNKKNAEIQDGILRPDGTVTQVAPDDWVFAARSLGDLARAFIPQNYTAAPRSNEDVINQTFNLHGGNDMPQVLRQQAYRGTQEGLLAIMQQSSQRLQLMSGTR